MHDVIVIGAGPAGLAAGAYSLSHHLKTLVIAPDLGGKAAYRLQLPWLKQREVIVGEETVEQLRQQLVEVPEPIRYFDSVQEVFLHGDMLQVHTVEGGAFPARAVIVATGVTPRTLGVPGERRLSGFGVSYSAASHAPLFAGRRVVVVGGNLRAQRAAAELRATAAHVTLIAPDQSDLSSYALGRQLLQDSRVAVRPDYTVKEIFGDEFVSGVDAIGPNGEVESFPADGVFIEMGLLSHTDFLGQLVERTNNGHIVVNAQCATRCPGLFAAGDISSTAYAEQILIALGEGVKAAISACAYVLEGVGNNLGGLYEQHTRTTG
ncbi:MAG: FAD-dependent oxidoreductase [Kouleothrix sp.]|nr:FAD-dependent oxidoreductase [Kouleothrix sp.]